MKYREECKTKGMVATSQASPMPTRPLRRKKLSVNAPKEFVDSELPLRIERV